MLLISVIMPVFNASLFIKEAIESILNQTYRNFELLICDDGSTDDTLKVIESIQDSRIKLFKNHRNRGNLETTNFLFHECQGEYVTIQDADDFSTPNRFEVLLSEFLKDSKLGMIGSNYEIINENKESISCGFLPLGDNEIKIIMLKEVIPILYASVMIKMEILKKVGGFRYFFNRKGFADLDWLARAAEITVVKNVREILYYYRKHEKSFTSMSNDVSYVWSNIHYLIVSAHKNRLVGKTDFFEDGNLKEVKFILSEYYIRKSENYYWENNRKKAFQMLFISFRCCIINFKIYNTFLYMLKNRKAI